MMRATATACSNIALIKYWGKRPGSANLPLNDSVSMTLSAATTTTTVHWDASLSQDEIYFDGERLLDHRATRISRFLDRLRERWYRMPARVHTMNSFPSGTGMASSASGFAALTVAGIAAFDEGLPPEVELSRLARAGSGSACRSLFPGYVEWVAGHDDESSLARPLLPPEHWDLRDIVVVLSAEEKEVSSSDGHKLAAIHPFMDARQQQLPARTLALKGALVRRDFETLATLVEHEALEMHAIMLSSQPAAIYFEPATIRVIKEVRRWRDDDCLPVCFTLDAGPNVHVICDASVAMEVRSRLATLVPTASLVECRPGPGVRVHGDHLCP